MATELPEIMIERQPPKARMTFEEFLDWCDEDTWAEWVDGEVIVFSPARDRHQGVSDFLISVLKFYVELRGLGWVRSAPFLMRLPNRPSGREPDILFVAKDRLAIIQETYLDGPADVVVEIVSPESVGRDRGDKFLEYETAGIKEYWFIDPDRRQTEFYRLGEGGQYQLVIGGAEGVFHSQVIPGFWLKIQWLWQDPWPSPVRVVAEICGLPVELAESMEEWLATGQPPKDWQRLIEEKKSREK